MYARRLVGLELRFGTYGNKYVATLVEHPVKKNRIFSKNPKNWSWYGA